MTPAINNIIEKSFANFEEILAQSTSFLSSLIDKVGEDDEGVLFYLTNVYDFQLWHLEILKCKEKSDLFTLLNVLLKKHKIIKKLKGLSCDSLEDYVKNQKDSYIILPLDGDDEFVYLVADTLGQPETSFYIQGILEIINKFGQRSKEHQSFLQENAIWEEAFLKITSPFALISEGKELLLHNAKFTRLNILLHECIKLCDGQKIELGATIYHINRYNFENEGKKISCFLFKEDLKDEILNSTATTQELGIVSSSLAHELNNPLGGILAGLDLLLLDEDWSSEELHSFAEMKKSAIRCKQLIEIFLGFSKVSTADAHLGPIKNAFDQSLNLLRFRMVETNIKLQFEFENDLNREWDKFFKQINISVMTMIFYLILSEVVTAFSHYKLLRVNINESQEPGGNLPNAVYGCLRVDETKIEIELRQELGFKQIFQSSKLITHLLKLVELKLVVASNKITLEV